MILKSTTVDHPSKKISESSPSVLSDNNFEFLIKILQRNIYNL